MDIEKFNVLAALVKEAKEADKITTAEMAAATTKWKQANSVLTDRMKVFDEFVASQKAEAISL